MLMTSIAVIGIWIEIWQKQHKLVVTLIYD